MALPEPSLRRAGALLLGLVLAASACPPSALTVTLTSAEPTFSISEPGQERPRYHTLELVRGGTRVWALRAEPFGDTASQGTVRYPQVPPGFLELVRGRPLEPGDYRLSVRGPLAGALRFTVAADGGVHPAAEP